MKAPARGSSFKASLEGLLYDLYEVNHSPRHYRAAMEEGHCSFETDRDTWTDSSQTHYSDARHGVQPAKLTRDGLGSKSLSSLRSLALSMEREAVEASQLLVRQLKRRDHQLSRAQAKANIVTAVLHALSPKRSVDARLQFSLEPPGTESGYTQWLEAMRAVARLPDGIPHHFRKKLWLTLAAHHVETAGLDWAAVVADAFSDRVGPEDEKLGEQIIKDLHRTGWSGLSGQGGETERVLLKRVLLAYARFNKTIGYCQGFNVIAALVLDVAEYKEEMALKVMIFLVEQVLPQGYFDETLRALSVDMAVLRDLLHQRLPKMAAHLDALQNNSESEYEPPLVNVFSMQWFLTLYATALPKAAVFRLWDSLMLQGSEVLLRAALAIWAKSARRVMKTESADQFYGVMGPLCAELSHMTDADCNSMIQVVYTMADFPYPGLVELRERHTWNIQPFSSTFRVLRQQVASILHSDGDEPTSPDPASPAARLPPATSDKLCGSLRSKGPTDLGSLQKQYKLIKHRQKQAAVIVQSAYETGIGRRGRSSSAALKSPPLPSGGVPVFNHLYIAQLSKKGLGGLSGAVPVTSRTVQPQRGGRRESALASQREEAPSRLSTDTNSTLHVATASITTCPEDTCRERSSLEDDEDWTPTECPFSSRSEGLLMLAADAKKNHRRSRSLPRNDFRPSATPSRRLSRSCVLFGDSAWEARRESIRAPRQSSKSADETSSLRVGALARGFVHDRLGEKRPTMMTEARSQQRPTRTNPGSPKKAPMDPSAEAALLRKSKAMLASIPGDERRMGPVFNPFPIRHRTRLIEREKKMGLL